MAMFSELPIPSHFQRDQVGEIWRVPYQQIATNAAAWSQKYQIPPAKDDSFRICLLLVDVQNTFCIPGFGLYVGGKSGTAAIEDNQRLCEFIYRNLAHITTIVPTMDTHTAMQIFHATFWVNDAGEHPEPLTVISWEDVRNGVWKVNPAVADSVADGDCDSLQKDAFHYVEQLTAAGKYPLTIWPYHAMLGGIGHALVPAVEEAVFFHNMARRRQTQFELKGDNPRTENYSVFSPEVLQGYDGTAIAQKNTALLEQLLGYDAIVIAGEAKSHCVAWTVEDLLAEIQSRDPSLAKKVYLLEDCTSPVVVPDVVDFTESANQTFQRFADAGMHLVNSQDKMADWLAKS